MDNTPIQQIKDKVDIVDFVGEYITLTRSGTNFKARCPFHNEKSPSFMVSRERQSWHCFGCNEGGDIFTFLQKSEGLSFVESLKILAQRAGVTLPNRRDVEYQASEKNRSKDALHLATQFFEAVLQQHEVAQKAREYVARRGLDDKTLREWHVGYAPDSFNALFSFCMKRGVSVDDLLSAGLVGKSDRGSFYDRFRDRVMFPIFDHHGAVVGFTGRLLEEKENQGKYVNTPQTAVFDKSALLYGLHVAKNALRKSRTCIIVEGQMDVITSHQFGFENTVASSGTALTDEQLRLIRRYTQKDEHHAGTLLFAFDQDGAGKNAALRGIMMALALGFDTKVIMPDVSLGKDADEIIRKNKEAWDTAIAQAVPFITFVIQNAIAQNNLEDPKGKQAIVSAALPYLQAIPSNIEREAWMQTLSQKVGVRLETLEQELRISKTKKAVIPQRGAIVPKKPEEPKEKEVTSPFVRLLALHIMLQKPMKDFLEVTDLVFPENYRPLYATLKNGYTDGTQNSEAEEPHHILMLLADHLYGTLPQSEKLQEYERLTARCKQLFLQAKKAHIEQQLRLAEAQGDREKAAQLLEYYQKLNGTL